MTSHWHVLGVGAIGGLYAHRLAKLGFAVTLLTRQPTSGERQLELITPDGRDLRVFPEQLITATEPIRHLLVSTKAFDAVAAIASIRERLTADAQIVVLANGMGYHGPIASAVAPARVIAATTTAGCRQHSPQQRMLAGAGITRLGWLGSADSPPDWFARLESADWPCVWEDSMTDAMLAKLAINAVINPLSALENVANGELLTPRLAADTQSAIGEVKQLLDWAGYDDLANTLDDAVTRVIADTAENISSMCADQRAGRRTEIDSILGFLLNELPPAQVGAARPDTPLLNRCLSALQPTAPDRR